MQKHMDIKIVHLYFLSIKVLHVCWINLFIYNLVYVLNRILVFVMCIVKQINKCSNLFVNNLKKYIIKWNFYTLSHVNKFLKNSSCCFTKFGNTEILISLFVKISKIGAYIKNIDSWSWTKLIGWFFNIKIFYFID